MLVLKMAAKTRQQASREVKPLTFNPFWDGKAHIVPADFIHKQLCGLITVLKEESKCSALALFYSGLFTRLNAVKEMCQKFPKCTASGNMARQAKEVYTELMLISSLLSIDYE